MRRNSWVGVSSLYALQMRPGNRLSEIKAFTFYTSKSMDFGSTTRCIQMRINGSSTVAHAIASLILLRHGRETPSEHIALIDGNTHYSVSATRDLASLYFGWNWTTKAKPSQLHRYQTGF